LERPLDIHGYQGVSGIVTNFDTASNLFENCVGLGFDHEKTTFVSSIVWGLWL
jgi:hypothetical protein